MKKIWSYLRHSDPKLRFSWYCLQLGLFIFPFTPALGAVGLFLSGLITFVLGYFHFGDAIDHDNPFGILGVSVNEIQVVKPFITVEHDY